MARLPWLSAILALALSSAGWAQSDIAASPAFSGEALSAPPTEGWFTNGGNLANQRFSPLTRIDRDNVKDLKAVWRSSLRGSGTSPRAGNQAQPLVHEGVIYIVTGENDVFAVSVDSGEILWDYMAGIDADEARPCCGWAVRGLGMGEGRIFVGRLDARLVALDQRSGDVLWDIQAEDPAEGYSITSAPLYFDGMVITGFAGGDLGTRGRIKAYDAEDGKLLWTFYTVPGPGEFGHDTWPQDSDVWKYGGASIWQTPAIDAELGMIYFTTGNPGPVLNGALRPGDNLFSVSMVALDVHTGEYRWHFQQVHHDIWDYDSPNPVILFEEEYEGELRKGIAQAAKTGWVYILDRVTGEPLIGIEEKPVMQEPRQFTSATQPYPVGDAIVPQEMDMPPEGFTLVNQGRIFTPYFDEPVLWKPLGAVNWPPSSYSPLTGHMYVCATDSTWGAVSGGPDYPVEPGALYSGSVVQRVDAPRRGVLAAMDLATNRLVWRQQWVDTCYSGTVVTASNLLFIGRNDGRLTALDAETGMKLWEFQTDGGVNATVSTFMYKGSQYVAVLAGGTALARSKHADGLWLFSLDGGIESLPPSAGQTTSGAPAARQVALPGDRQGDAANGARLFAQSCQVCHGEDGRGGLHGGADLSGLRDAQHIADTVANGSGDMPAFGTLYEPAQLQDLAAHVLNLGRP